MAEARDANLTWLMRIDKVLRKQRFFGELKLIYQNGKIVKGQKSESLKPERNIDSE